MHGGPVTTYVPSTIEIADDSPEAIAELFETRGLGDGLPVVAPTPAARRRHARARGRRSRRGARHPAPPRRDRHPPRRRHQRGARRLPAGDVPRRAHRGPRAGAPGDEPARRERDHAPGRADWCWCTARSHDGAGFASGVGAFGPGNRANATVGRAVRLAPAPRRGRTPGFGRRGHARAAGEVHVLRGREPRRVTVGGLRREPGRRRAERGHRALRRGPAQRARHGEGRRPAAHPRQDRVGDGVARHEQRADQPGRVLRDPRARARVQPRQQRVLARRRVALPLRPRPHARRRRSGVTSRSWRGRSG